MADIKVYGTLHAQTGDGVVARAAQILDEEANLMQSVINQRVLGMNNVGVSISGTTLTISIS